jgi:hypothetical protein
LATLDDAACGAASEVTPKFISPSDPGCAGARRWNHAVSRQYERLPGVRIESPLHEWCKAHRDAQCLRGRTRACVSARLRKKVEMRFAHLKRNLNFRRLRLRGLIAGFWEKRESF